MAVHVRVEFLNYSANYLIVEFVAYFDTRWRSCTQPQYEPFSCDFVDIYDLDRT